MWFRYIEKTNLEKDFHFDAKLYEQSFFRAIKPRKFSRFNSDFPCSKTCIWAEANSTVHVFNKWLNYFFASAFFLFQVIGLFPVDIRPENPCKIHFRWKSLRTLFSLSTIFTSFATSLIYLNHQFQQGPLTPRNVRTFSNLNYRNFMDFSLGRLLHLFTSQLSPWSQFCYSIYQNNGYRWWFNGWN